MLDTGSGFRAVVPGRPCDALFVTQRVRGCSRIFADIATAVLPRIAPIGRTGHPYACSDRTRMSLVSKGFRKLLKALRHDHRCVSQGCDAQSWPVRNCVKPIEGDHARRLRSVAEIVLPSHLRTTP